MYILIHIVASEKQFIYYISYHSNFVLYFFFLKKRNKSYSFQIHIFKYHIFPIFQKYNPSAAMYIISIVSQFYYSPRNLSKI